jgi:hypothetical protein
MSDRSAPSIADSLEPLLQTRADRISVKDIVERVQEHQGLAPVVCVLTLPVLLPFPPGFSLVLGLPLLAAAPQMMLGRKRLWLPQSLRGRAMDRDKVQKGVRRILPWLQRLERLSRPRLTFLTGQAGAVLAGAICTVMAVALVLPLPFANLLPALTVLLLSLGITRRDGAAVIAGCLLLAAAVTALVWGLHGARLGLHRLLGGR